MTSCSDVQRLQSDGPACSCLQGGVPKKHWDTLRWEVLHTYGHEHILTLAALQEAGETFTMPGL